ncbi:GNAT family N-acetyltransferase [Aureibacillus halotolerans]|uniref:Putative acetyltransferase n=1 Tax=Aureibacillus halotolerans TaxID=1508390 RepID=A0A4R6U6Z1_9BACI|nr:GNAT family N-acetyltransferase [Aureibacillus halotolerans]TDQ42290.1 putative acetyltransferase [Aureibacillus halotolerans]
MKQGIHQLTIEDAPALVELSQYAFQRPLGEEEKHKRIKETKAHEFWGYFDQGHLASVARIHPLSVFLDGELVNMGGIGNVATWPEYRRNRYVSHLITHVLTLMKQEGNVVSFLAPFSFPFYRRFGWESLVTRKHYEINKDNLPTSVFVTNYLLKRMESRFSEELQHVYTAYAKRYNSMLNREKAWWERIFTADKKLHVYGAFTTDGVCKGYMIYSMQERHLDVSEFVALDEEAKKTLWNVFKQHDSMADSVTLLLPEDDQTPYAFRQQGITQTLKPYFMGRIVDVFPFLQAFPFKQNEAEISIEITDEVAPWNTGTYVLSKDGNVSRSNAQGQLQFDVQTLAALCLASVSPEVLYREGWISGAATDVATLAERLPTSTSFFLDFF